MKIALLITTFNRPNALDLVLETVACQSVAPDEVVVCDDGSFIETSSTIQIWSSILKLRHVWQPDTGFRAARSRNLGVAKTNADYLILIDGDCLLPPNFVEAHVCLARPRHLVAGGRHLLSKFDTDKCLTKKLKVDQVFKRWKFRYLPLGFMRDLKPFKWESVRSCNLGLFRDDLLSIQGFDESFVGWGREDSDFIVRLLHSGTKIRSGRLASCVAHLHHVSNKRDQLGDNDLRFQYSLSTVHHTLPELSVLAST